MNNPAAVCAPATADLTAAAVTAGSTAGLTYTYWTDAAATSAYATPSAASAGTYYIRGASADGCFDIQPVTVTVNPTPSVEINNPAAVCSPATAQPTSAAVTAGSTAGLTYTYWTDAAATSAYATPSAATAGTYYIRGASADGCFDIQPVTVTANPVPNITDQTTSATSGVPFAFTPAGAPAGTTYTWTPPSYTGTVAGGTAQAAAQTDINGTLTGTGTATYTVTPTLGSCSGAPFTVTVTVSSACVPVTIATQPSDISMCAVSGSTSLTVVTSGTGPFTYQWEDKDAGSWGSVVNGTPAGAVYANENSTILDISDITNSGNYQYRVTSMNCSGAGTITSNTVTLTVNGTPAVVINNPAAVCSPAPADLTAAAVTAGSTAGLTYTYSTDAAATSAYATPSAASAGNYYIRGASTGGCFDIQPVTVTANPVPKYYRSNNICYIRGTLRLHSCRCARGNNLIPGLLLLTLALLQGEPHRRLLRQI